MTYAGFDRADCPPLDMMARLLAETNLVWTGFYLPAPSQSGSTWRGKRAALVNQGWGLAPIFVGQETVGPGSHAVTATQGTIDGVRACTDMHAEGFELGCWVYLDLENGTPFTPAEQAYVGAWVDAVEAGGFRAGVYCSFQFAAQVLALRPSVRIWVFHVPTTLAHPVDGTYFIAPDPAKSGFDRAVMWQCNDSCKLTAFGGLLVDLDSSTMRDPGAPDETAAHTAAASVPPQPKTVVFPSSAHTTEWAMAVQTWLNAHGASPALLVDGDFGPVSKDALTEFFAKLDASA